MRVTEYFKKCSMCSKIWETRDEFLDDESLQLDGYGADFEKLENGVFYFTHNAPGCFTTMALKAGEFFSLYTGKKYPESKMGSDECPQLCLDREELDRCPAFCEYAFVREITQIIRDRHGHVAGSGSDQTARDAEGAIK